MVRLKLKLVEVKTRMNLSHLVNQNIELDIICFLVTDNSGVCSPCVGYYTIYLM